MPVGLEVFDDKGNKILGMDKSMLRIVQVLKTQDEIGLFLQTRQPSDRRILLISSFVDLDKYGQDMLATEWGFDLQFLKYAETVLLAEFVLGG